MTDDQVKRCPRCREEKELDEFFFEDNMERGERQDHCKICDRIPKPRVKRRARPKWWV